MLLRTRKRVFKPTWPFTPAGDILQEYGVVGWWPGEPNRNLTVYDQSGHKNHGTFTGTIPAWNIWVNGKDGNKAALTYDGTTNYTNLASGIANFNPQVTTKFSMGGWVNTTLASVGNLIASWNFSVTNGFAFSVSGSGLPGFILTNTSGASLYQVTSSSVVVNTGKWLYVVVTYSGGSTANNITIYVNGIAIAVTVNFNTPPGTLTNTQIVFGKILGSVPQFYTGLMEDWVVSNNCWTTQQVWYLYEPKTRWQFRHQLGKRRYFVPVVAAGNRRRRVIICSGTG